MSSSLAPSEPAKIDVILPVHPGKGDHLDLLRAANCLASFVATGSDAAIGRFFIVHPRGLGSLVQALVPLSAKVACVLEDDMFERQEYVALRTFGGWRRQQFIKLAANRLSDADVFLTCDADVASINPLTAAAVVQDGRVLVQGGSQIAKWVAASFGMFDVAPPTPLMSVTPAFLARAGLEAMQRLITDMSGENWIMRLAREANRGVEWTEYMTYQAALTRLGRWDDLHFVGKGHPINQGIWRRSLDDDALIQKLGARKPLFFVYQSTREDFFLSQAKLAAAGMPTLAAADASRMLPAHQALLEFHEIRRYWAKVGEPTLGRFRSDYVDLLRALLGAAPMPDPDALFVTLGQIWLGAVMVAEATIDKARFKATAAAATAAMRAWPALAEAMAGSPDFETFLRIAEGAKETPPAALVPLLLREDTSRPLFKYLLARMRSGPLEDLLAVLEARMARKRAPFYAVIDTAVWLAPRELGKALSVMRRGAPTFRHRYHYWLRLSEIWALAGKPRAAARAGARAQALEPAEEAASPAAA